MQPHLKKCFEGIAKLDFTKDLAITGMISSEQERVPFTENIYPADAKVRHHQTPNASIVLSWMCNCKKSDLQGMVEKWLLQVEVLMLKSVRDVIRQGVHQYAEVSRKLA